MSDDGNNGSEGERGYGLLGNPRLMLYDDCQIIQSGMSKNFDRVERKVDKINVALFGSDGTGNTGILNSIRVNQNKILQIEVQGRIAWYVTALIISVISTVLTAYLVSVLC